MLNITFETDFFLWKMKYDEIPFCKTITLTALWKVEPDNTCLPSVEAAGF
jgi:hypothetical protein